MIRFARSIPILFVLLAACAPALATKPPTAPPTSVPMTAAVPAVTAPALAATYRDEANGFELDYPSGWSTHPNSVIGSRGSQAQLLSPGTTAESLAAGGSRLSITIYQWDPKSDLGAFIAHRREAWDASGFKVRDGSLTQLADGRPAADFLVEPPDGTVSYFLLTTLGDQYLELAGEGDLTVLEFDRSQPAPAWRTVMDGTAIRIAPTGLACGDWTP